MPSLGQNHLDMISKLRRKKHTRTEPKEMRKLDKEFGGAGGEGEEEDKSDPD